MDIENAAINDIEAYVKRLSEPELSCFVSQLIDVFESTCDTAKRNALALVLGDFKKLEVVESIIKMLKNPKTQKSRGTLLYALTELDYTEHLDFLVSLLIDGGFEVKREAFLLIEKAIANNNQNLIAVKKQSCM